MKELIKIVYHSDKCIRFYLLLILLIAILSSSISVCLPIIFKNMINNIDKKIIVFHCMILYAVTLFAERFFNEFQFIIYPYFENKTLKIIYKYIFDNIFDNYFLFFKNKLPGELTANLYQAVHGLDSLMFDAIFKLFPVLLTFIFISVIFSFNFTPVMTLVIICGSCLYVVMAYKSNKILVNYQSDIRNLTLEAQGFTADLITSWKDIKITKARSFINEKLNNKINATLHKSVGFYQKKGIYSFFQGLILCFVIVLINLLAIDRYMSSQLTVGDLVLINNYLLLVLRPLESLSLIFRSLVKNYSDFYAMYELVNVKKDFHYVSNISELSSIHLSEINIEGMLYNINLDIRKGEKIAIIGSSGSGKSTLLNLITGFHDGYKGNIYVNDDKNSAIDPILIRQFVAYYHADSRLFASDILTNITLGRDVDHKKYLKSTFLTNKVNQMPEGVYAHISEHEKKLSTGEAQRLKISRTLALSRDFEFYDEVTSALDEGLTEKILDVILSQKDKAVVFVTHNLKCINKFDKIFLLNNGFLSELNREAHEYV